MEDDLLDLEQPIFIKGVKFLFYHDTRALMMGVGPIVPLVLCHKDQCAEFMFLLSKVKNLLTIG